MLPSTTILNKRIPKQKFYDNLSITPKIKRIFIDNIKSIMSEVRTRDQFVSTRLTNRSIMHANQLVGNEVASTSFSIPSSDRVRNEFIREFYRMDLETRDLLKEIIKLHMSDYRL